MAHSYRSLEDGVLNLLAMTPVGKCYEVRKGAFFAFCIHSKASR